MTRNILYIHGAYASGTTFTHMVGHFPAHAAVFADYNCLNTSVANIVRILKETVAEQFGGEPYSIVAHSLGGVVGLSLAASGEPVEQIFTMSAPFGGSQTASVLALLFFLTPVFADINPHSATIRGILEGGVQVPVRSIVSTGGGSPLLPEANDGVVTVASQIQLVGPEYHTVDCNHFDVVQAGPVIHLAREFLFDAAA